MIDRIKAAVERWFLSSQPKIKSWSNPFKPRRIEDEKYRKYIRTLPCLACGSTPSDAAHIRCGQTGGMGLTPSDEYLNPLCRACHRNQHDWPGGEADWWMEAVIKPQAQKRYLNWIARQDQTPQA